MSVPPGAVLGGLLILTSFVLSPAVVTVPGTDWVEPTLLWLTISMLTGSRKTTIYQFLRQLLQEIREKAQCSGNMQYDTKTQRALIHALTGDLVLDISQRYMYVNSPILMIGCFTFLCVNICSILCPNNYVELISLLPVSTSIVYP